MNGGVEQSQTLVHPVLKIDTESDIIPESAALQLNTGGRFCSTEFFRDDYDLKTEKTRVVMDGKADLDG